MPVRNIECQIAQAQMGRYLNGDPFSEDAQRQLEEHLRECPECGGLLRARKKALLSLLAPTHAVVEIEEAPAPADPQPISTPNSPKTASEALIDLITRSNTPLTQLQPKPQPAPQPAQVAVEERLEPAPQRAIFTKPLILSGLLAITLIVMTQLAKNPETLFGPRLATKTPVTTPITTPTEPEVESHLSDWVPTAFVGLLNDFDGSPAAQQAAVDATTEMLARMDEPEIPAPGPDVQTQATPAPAIQTAPRRPAARRTQPRANQNQNRIRTEPAPPAVRVYPPETNP